MAEVFDVTRGGQAVGRAEIKREGLYCRIICRCQINDHEIHRLYADGEKIGVLVPEGKELVLETRVAAKRLKEGCCFFLDQYMGEFIPICPGEPFYHLDKLRKRKLLIKNGVPGMENSAGGIDTP